MRNCWKKIVLLFCGYELFGWWESRGKWKKKFCLVSEKVEENEIKFCLVCENVEESEKSLVSEKVEENEIKFCLVCEKEFYY